MVEQCPSERRGYLVEMLHKCILEVTMEVITIVVFVLVISWAWGHTHKAVR